MTNRIFAMLLLVVMLVPLSACGGDEDTYAASEETTFDLSQLPADFPRQLIPPSYDRAEYNDLTQMGIGKSATFESSLSVDETIKHYTALLGEPTINADPGDGSGERGANWYETPWMPWIVTIMGGPRESIVGVLTLPER